MATYKNGISGTFYGKVGTVVGSTWNGIDYMRSLPRKSKRPPTEAQKAQRSKLSLAISFLSPVSELINIGFRNDTMKKSGFNTATSYLLQECITGNYPDFSIDFSKVLISSGNLTGAWNTTLASESAGSLLINWTDNSGSGTARSTDQAMILVYDSAGDRHIYNLDGASRSSAGDIVFLPADFSGSEVDVWIGFRSLSRNSVSTSIYAGRVEVA